MRSHLSPISPADPHPWIGAVSNVNHCVGIYAILCDPTLVVPRPEFVPGQIHLHSWQVWLVHFG